MKSSESSEFPYKERITSIERRRVGDIAPNERNPKRPTEEKRERLTAVLSQFGKAGVLLTYIGDDGKERFFDGNTRRNLDPDDVWYIAKTDLTQAEVDSLVLFYDPLAEPDWEAELVKMLAAAVDVEGDALAGMLDEILAEVGAELGKPEPGDAEPQTDRAEELRALWGVELGQMWRLPSRAEGQEHRLICGDCTDASVVERVMGGNVADIEIHDPPYGMNLDTDFSGMESKMFKGKTGGASYAPLHGDDKDFDPVHLLTSKCKELFLWGADYYCERIPRKNDGSWFVWDKRLDESADKMWGSCFETLWSKTPHKRDMIRIKWAGIFGMEGEPDKERVHPTQKPTAVYTWLLEKYSNPSNITADYYLGGGSHLIAAENLSRQCRAVEISPAYVAVALQRYQDAFGITAELLP